MPDAITIPCLPCVSLEDTFPFYEMLGFEVTYRQKAPNVYGVVRRGACELHFFGLKGLEPKAAFSTCLVLMSDVEGLHQIDRARALVVRAELAIALGDSQHAIRLQAEIETLPLSETDRERLRDELLITG